MSVIGNLTTGRVGSKIVVAAWSCGYSASGNGRIGFERSVAEPICICDNNYFTVDAENKAFNCVKAGKYIVYYFFKSNISSTDGTRPTYTVSYSVKKGSNNIASGTTNAGVLKASSTKQSISVGSSISGQYSVSSFYDSFSRGIDAALVIVEA